MSDADASARDPHAGLLTLASKGRRVTSSRRLVVEAMSNATRPFTVEDLCGALPGVGRATVFRTVRLLVGTNVLCRVVIEDGTVRYQLSTSSNHHHHLVCSRCGSVQEFVDPKLDRLIESNAKAHHFDLASHAMELYGVCSNCRESSPATT